MLGGGDRKARRTLRAVVVCGKDVRGHVVRAEKIDEVRGAAERGRLHRRDAARAKVVELEAEREGRRDLAACPLEVVREDLLLLARLRADRHRVPDLHEQRLEVIAQPEAFGVGVLDGHEHVLDGDGHALRERLDHDRQPAAMLLDDVLPARAVEVLHLALPHVRVDDLLRRINLGRGDDNAGKVPLEDVLQPEERHLRKLAAARLKVGVHRRRARRVLPPVRRLRGAASVHGAARRRCSVSAARAGGGVLANTRARKHGACQPSLLTLRELHPRYARRGARPARARLVGIRQEHDVVKHVTHAACGCGAGSEQRAASCASRSTRAERRRRVSACAAGSARRMRAQGRPCRAHFASVQPMQPTS